MTLHAAGPAGTAHNPFAGERHDGAGHTFPAARYEAIGASEEEVADLRSYFDSLTWAEQGGAVAWHDKQSDEQLHESLERFRAARDAHAALAGLSDEEREALEELTDEQRAELAALTPEQLAELTPGPGPGPLTDEEATALAELTDEQRAELAALTPEQCEQLKELAEDAEDVADGEAVKQAAYDELSQEDKDALAQLSEDELAALKTPPVEQQAAAPGEQQAAGSDDDEQSPTFWTSQIADLRIDEVMELVDKGVVTAAQALAAEQDRGEHARPKLMKRLAELT